MERGLARSRSQAQEIIKAGLVCVNNHTVTKPSFTVEADTSVRVTASEITQFVSRGGLKLAGAIQHLGLNLEGLLVLDIGQSTGGFTDCVLQLGASLVVGVDVGQDQLAASIKRDPRVISFEGVNARDLPAASLLPHTANKGFSLAVMDVSFISQTHIIPTLESVLSDKGEFLSLVKPQFELQPEQIGKNGLVKSADYYPLVERKIKSCLAEHSFDVLDYFESPIVGGDGNREFFVYARRSSGQ
ncbi:TlyA family RNA methyltransferase [Simiduia sp. 21SJ11W-1]|uniref:TlyA family RNA methyltransferase n=1 Tax=Simiduia sp. 21SJ11W-1 TaxID=2909669 RepID=UPI0020A1C62F|nr:TlyA family RNA methyltransferase [Simiduia sp. 21SJ11W-1]UTA47955.1 TlyA family RNA methyltransferase [Simiduia sp. 21SJ11W-1]